LAGRLGWTEGTNKYYGYRHPSAFFSVLKIQFSVPIQAKKDVESRGLYNLFQEVFTVEISEEK
jgi:hypothetical protein